MTSPTTHPHDLDAKPRHLHDDDAPAKPKAAAPAKKCTVGELKARVKELVDSTGGHDRNLQEINTMVENME